MAEDVVSIGDLGSSEAYRDCYSRRIWRLTWRVEQTCFPFLRNTAGSGCGRRLDNKGEEERDEGNGGVEAGPP